MTTDTQSQTLHVRYNGQSFDIPLDHFDIGPNTSDASILAQVEAHPTFGLEPGAMNGMVVKREPNGNITVHPPAFYG